MENDKLKKFIKTTIREFLNENINNYIKWDSLSNSVKNDITENIYHNNKYVEKNYWNPESLKDSINDLIHEHQPKFKIEYKDTNNLYNELTQIGWGVSEKNVERLISILRNGDELDPIILNDGKFFDGGHRLTAYKRMRIYKIPTIDIGFMLKFDYQKWENGEIDF
jgi:hypothetical protein